MTDDHGRGTGKNTQTKLAKGISWPLKTAAFRLLVAVLLAAGCGGLSAAQPSAETAEQDDLLPEPPRELQISADSVDMQLAQGKASFRGNVVVLDRGLRIEAEMLDVELNERREITDAVFQGGVQIRAESQDQTATAERATYNMVTEELVLTGGPVLRVGDRTLRNARKILYNRATQRIRTEGAADGERPTVTIPLASPSSGSDE